MAATFSSRTLTKLSGVVPNASRLGLQRRQLHGIRALEEPSAHRLTNQSKVATTAEEAIAMSGLTSSQGVFLHSAAATPTPLVEAMVTHVKSNALKDITVCHMHVEGNAPYQAADVCGPGRPFRVKNFFLGANARQSVAEGRGEYVPIFLSEIPKLFRQGVQPVDVALVSVSPPDRHGFCSLGPSVDITRSALQSAKTIVAMVNPQMPRTFGDATVHVSHIDVMWHNDTPVHNLHKKKEGGPATDAIGKLVAENLVKDGATLQMGIGGIPNAVLNYLESGGAKDLGIHSEMVSDGIVKLWENGVITGARKSVHPGKITAGFAIGSKKLYDMLDDNPGVVMRDIAFVNATDVIARQPGMTAINSAVEVDITGQVAADSIGTRVYSGVGGQMDFMRGAALAPDGKPIIALPSTTEKGQSRIVGALKLGSAVVTTRAHVHYVVTEHGIAELWGKSLQERAKALISVAAPEHRDELIRVAKERLLW